MIKSIKRPIKEMGIVIGIEYKNAFDSFTDKKTGKTVEGQPERYKIQVLSGQVYDKELGFEDSTVNEYIVKDLKFAKSLKFLTKVWAVFEISPNGVKPLDIAIRE